MKRESKIESTNRLRSEGRWEEASEFRAKIRQKYRAEGLTRKQARQLAWDAMQDRYPPLGTDPYTGYVLDDPNDPFGIPPGR